MVCTSSGDSRGPQYVFGIGAESRNTPANFPDGQAFEEIYRVESLANRLVVYPSDLIDDDWVRGRQFGGDNSAANSIVCSPDDDSLSITIPVGLLVANGGRKIDCREALVRLLMD